MIIFQRGRLKLTKAAGFRLGVGYLPHYKSNPYTNNPHALIAWCGPYIVTFNLPKRNWERPPLWDPKRIAELHKARRNITEEIQAAYRAQRRWINHINMGRHYGMGEAKLQQQAVHPEVVRRWQAESDAVKLRDMEKDL